MSADATVPRRRLPALTRVQGWLKRIWKRVKALFGYPRRQAVCLEPLLDGRREPDTRTEVDNGDGTVTISLRLDDEDVTENSGLY